MSNEACTTMELLVQADLDGELGAAEAAQVAAHLQHCPDCAALPQQLASLSGRIRRESLYHSAPDALRAAVQAQFGSAASARVPASRRFWRPDLSRFSARSAVPFGAGFALAACLLFAIGMPPSSIELPNEVVSAHIRALQPGHLMDVASTDQHTVKPWFDGKLDFAPPVTDLKAAGFPLVGARLDYLASREAAVLVYQRRQHVIDVYVWPEHGRAVPALTSVKGYNVVLWRQNAMAFWAVSDLNAPELDEFVQDFRMQ